MNPLFQDRECWEIAHGLIRCYGAGAPSEVCKRMDRSGSREHHSREAWRSILKAAIWLSERTHHQPIWAMAGNKENLRMAA